MIGRVETIGAISSGRYLGTRPEVCRLHQRSSMMADNLVNQIVR
jgi:hypothetical protein